MILAQVLCVASVLLKISNKIEPMSPPRYPGVLKRISQFGQLILTKIKIYILAGVPGVLRGIKKFKKNLNRFNVFLFTQITDILQLLLGFNDFSWSNWLTQHLGDIIFY